MKRIFAIILAIVLITGFAFAQAGIPGKTVSVSPKLMAGEYRWDFEISLANTTEAMQKIVSLEIVGFAGGEEVEAGHITGTDLLNEGYVEKVDIAPGEVFSLYLTTEVLPVLDEYLFILTARDENYGSSVTTWTFELTDTEKANTDRADAPADMLPESAEIPEAPMEMPVEVPEELSEEQSAPMPEGVPAVETGETGCHYIFPQEIDGSLHWNFFSVFENTTEYELTLESIIFSDARDGRWDVMELSAKDLMYQTPVTIPGGVFTFDDWHPVVPNFAERWYTFVFSTNGGGEYRRTFVYEMSPEPMEGMVSEPETFRNDHTADLGGLFSGAEFEVEVANGVWWVPAISLGGSRFPNAEVFARLNLSPEEKQAEFSTLFEALQLYRISGFYASDDNVRNVENGINWEHHKPGHEAVKTNNGCCATSANWLNYILAGDYEEVGFFAISQYDGNGHIFNYILHDGYYYFVDLTNHRLADAKNAPETGNLEDYYRSDFVLSNVHRAVSPEAFWEYIQASFNAPPALGFMYMEDNCLPLDCVVENGKKTIVYGTWSDTNIRTFDASGGEMGFRFTDMPDELFVWDGEAFDFPR